MTANEGEGTFVTDTTDIAAPAAESSATDAAPARKVALSAMRLPQLQALATELGVKGTGRMRKSDLLEAIRAKQSGGSEASASDESKPAQSTGRRTRRSESAQPTQEQLPEPQTQSSERAE